MYIYTYIYIIPQVALPNTFYYEYIAHMWLKQLRSKGKDRQTALTAIGKWEGKGNPFDCTNILIVINMPNSHWYIVPWLPFNMGSPPEYE